MKYVILVFGQWANGNMPVEKVIGPFSSDAEAHLYASDLHVVFNVVPMEEVES